MQIKRFSINLQIIIILSLLAGCINFDKSIRINENSSYYLYNKINLQNQIVSPIIVYEQDIYIHTLGYIYSLNSISWKINWRSKCPGSVRNSNLFVSKSSVFAPDKYGIIYQFNRKSGSLTRSYEISRSLPQIIRPVDAIYFSGEVLIIGYSGSTVIAWDVINGKQIWDIQPTPRSNIYITGYDNQVIIGTLDNTQIVDLKSGDIIKSFATESPVTFVYNLSNEYFIFVTSTDKDTTINLVNKDDYVIDYVEVINSNKINCITKTNNSIYFSGQGLFVSNHFLGEIYQKSTINPLGCVSVIKNDSLVSFELSEKLVFLSLTDNENVYTYNYFSNILKNYLLRTDPIVLKDQLIVPAGSILYVYKP